MSVLPLALPALQLADGVTLLPGRAGPGALGAALEVIALAPPRVMATPWGKKMSVAMTNCGALGWVSDAAGYRYAATDPLTGLPWPAMPEILRALARDCAAAAGYGGFAPQACLVNLYGPAARMGLHQDRDEGDVDHPVVSVSFGRSGLFRFGGTLRRDPTGSIMLHHGDVLVFGGAARLMHHGIDRLEGPPHEVVGDRRINLTFRHVAPKGGVSA